MKRTIDWTRINNDSNGNPRHVCHFLAFIGPNDAGIPLDQKYDLALKRARKLGGRKYHNKSYGGGIVFQEYGGNCLDNLTDKIIALSGESTFEAMSRRAVVLVSFHPCTGAPNSDNRYKVVIRDFPAKFYDASIAENAGIHGQDQAEYFADMRVNDLKLRWTFAAAGTLPDGSAVFTVQ